jgi:hypothetical protein
VATDLLEGEILEQYGVILNAEKKYPQTVPETQAGCSLPATCSEGCESSDCTTDERKKKQHPKKKASGWFDPPAARA